MEAEKGVSELGNTEGQKNSFVQDFLLKREVKYVNFSTNLPRRV